MNGFGVNLAHFGSCLVLCLINQLVGFDPWQAAREFVKYRFTPRRPAHACLRVLDMMPYGE
jgi:hypothetical protein